MVQITLEPNQNYLQWQTSTPKIKNEKQIHIFIHTHVSFLLDLQLWYLQVERIQMKPTHQVGLFCQTYKTKQW